MPFPVENSVKDLASHPARVHSARRLYFDLLDDRADDGDLQNGARFLEEQLAKATLLDADLPDNMDDLGAWLQAGVERVGQSYRQYLEARQSGGARRYFPTKSHALYFLQSVAPTKLVDGAWLYGVLPRWQDARFASLIKTYLEELGEGATTKNHVLLYKKLLASHGLERWDDLSDEHYVQGAIQLALAFHAERFLPEVIGFNLGYEQLPLHLLVTAYELKELGIDPYYFTLHITVDNADCGHAKQAVDAVFNAMPKAGDAKDFWRRVANGYKLNLLGANTSSIIASFDLEREMHAIFARKSVIGRHVHSNYRRVAGRTINDWLSDAAQIPAFTSAMEQEGWFKRHEDPRNSRFWKLIQGEKAKMFGVFDIYEQQVIFDWIAGEARGEYCLEAKSPVLARPPLSFEAKQRLRYTSQGSVRAIENSDFDAEARALEERLALSTTEIATMSLLIAWMSPANHHTAPGLMATRIFNEIWA